RVRAVHRTQLRADDHGKLVEIPWNLRAAARDRHAVPGLLGRTAIPPGLPDIVVLVVGASYRSGPDWLHQLDWNRVLSQVPVVSGCRPGFTAPAPPVGPPAILDAVRAVRNWLGSARDVVL